MGVRHGHCMVQPSRRKGDSFLARTCFRNVSIGWRSVNNYVSDLRALPI